MSKVYLVGAGNNLNQLTIKAFNLIMKADVIIYDALIDSNILKINNKAKKIFVGKRKGKHSYSQNQINKILLKESQSNKLIVRLKGGDPFIFGRGGEEIQFLKRYNIEFEVIPGISSFISAASKFNIPITHRDYNHSFLVLSGYNLNNIDFSNLASYSGNIYILMGVDNIYQISQALIKNGMNPDTWLAYFSQIGNNTENVLYYKLKEIKEDTYKNLIKPGIIFLGPILNDRALFLLEEKPSLLITRPSEFCEKTIEFFEEKNIKTYSYPLIEIKQSEIQNNELEKIIKNIALYNYIIFTSRNGVNYFFKKFLELKKDIRILSNIKIGAIGPSTGKELNKYGIQADFIPNKFSSEGLFKYLNKKVDSKDSLLLIRSEQADSYLYNNLKSITNVTQINIYSVIPIGNSFDFNQVIQKNKIKGVILSSSIIAQQFKKLVNPEFLKELKVFTIGPKTSKPLGEIKFYQAETYSFQGIEKLLEKEL